MRTLAIAAAAIVVMATGAIAAEPDEAAEAKQEKKICKSEKMTGSLTRVRRICMTQREWDEVAAASRRGLNDLDRQQNTNVGDSSS